MKWHPYRWQAALSAACAALTLGMITHAANAADVVTSRAASAQAEKNTFVTRKGSQLYLRGKRFRFAGANNYYPIYKSPFMVDALFEKASASGFDVMRVWGAIDIGNQDGSNSVDGPKEQIYFQYWDGSAPAFNDGANGLQRLDYVIYKAGQEGLKLVIPFVNNWREFGGVDQYVRWRGGQYHDDFYTDPLIRQWYKDWIAHLLNRVNIYTGIAYKDDPTIMTWELANEPRCIGSGVYPRSATCTATTLVEWADDVARFVKSIDANHLVSVGDEGFYCDPGAADWTENCNEGVDSIAFTRLPHIDVMSVHLYPEPWGKDVAWGAEWIRRHIRDARALGKAVMIGEFGLPDKNVRNPTYQLWTDVVFEEGGNGALYWILSDLQDNGTLYPDFDQLTVYCPSPVCRTMSNFATMMQTGKARRFAPVADDDVAVTAFGTSVSVAPLDNDIDYLDAELIAESVDLEPSIGGQQTTLNIAAGTFALQADGTVTFTPAVGFSGNAQATYTVRDCYGRRSNAATLRITVQPDPSAALTLFSFENGTDGWASASWQTNAGTVQQSTEFAAEGAASLRVDAADGGWFGVTLAEPANLSQRARLRIDVRTTIAGTSTNVALQLGSGFTWCEGAWGWIDPNTTGVVDIDLSALSCGSAAQLNDVRGMYLFLSGGSTHFVDAVRAE